MQQLYLFSENVSKGLTVFLTVNYRFHQEIQHYYKNTNSFTETVRFPIRKLPPPGANHQSNWPTISVVVYIAESINEYSVIDAGCQRRCWMSITKLSEKTQASLALALSFTQTLLSAFLFSSSVSCPSRTISSLSPACGASTSHVESIGSKWI